MDRYQEALAGSRVPVDKQVVDEAVAKIVEKAPEYASPEVYQFLFSSIDLTTLSTTDTQRSVARFTQRVNEFDNDYPQFKPVAAICVYSNFAEVVKTNLDVPGVDIAVVAGGFPSSQTFGAREGGGLRAGCGRRRERGGHSAEPRVFLRRELRGHV